MILDHYLWWIAAGVLVVAEIMTGTFYILMVAVGCAAGGIAGFLGLDVTIQTLIGVIVGLVALFAWHRFRRRTHPRAVESGKNPDLHLDLGATIEVQHWVEGHARVNYRGSQWDAVPEHPQAPETGKLIVKAVRGSTLVLGSHHQAA